MRIGVLEDDKELAQYLQSQLGDADYEACIFQSGQRLINFLLQETVDLLILDWNVPDMSGYSVACWVRDQANLNIPIIMLTSRTADSDIVLALTSGCDDYITKPVQTNVLLARMEAVFRRSYPKHCDQKVETFGLYEFHKNSKSVCLSDRDITLASKEFALALLFFQNVDRMMSRDYLFNALWGRTIELETRTLDSHVSKIRNKLEIRPVNGFRLVSVYGFGYRLEAMN